MVEYALARIFVCDICQVKKITFEGERSWKAPPSWWRRFRGKVPETSICGDCILVIREARKTHKDPLVDLVNRKREEI